MKHVLYPAAISMICLMVPEAKALSRSEKEILDRVLNEHAAALGSIRTLYCRVVTTSSIAGSAMPAQESKCWKSLDDFFLQTKRGNVITETLIREGKVTMVTKGSPADGPKRPTVYIQADDPASHPAPWGSICLPVVYGSENKRMTLRDFLEKSPSSFTKVRKVTDGGRSLVEVELTDNFGRWMISFDLGLNSLVVKTVFSSKERDNRGVNEFSYKEVAPAIYFLNRHVSRTYVGDKTINEGTSTVAEVVVNKPVKSEVFSLRLPPGELAMDQIQGKVFTVKPDGTLGPPPPDFQLTAAQPLRANQDSSAVTWLSVTAEEPKSMTRWIAPASLGVLTLAGACWLVRRWRRPAA